MTSFLEAAQGIADLITDDDVTAYVDPRKALANRPCVLVGPPTLDYAGGTMTGPSVQWQLFALSSHQAGSVEALDELDPLVTRVNEAVGAMRAAPAQYSVGDSRIAAYLITTQTY